MPFQPPLFTFDTPPNKDQLVIKTYCSSHIKASMSKKSSENDSGSFQEGTDLDFFFFLIPALSGFSLIAYTIDLFAASQPEASGDGFWIVF